VNIKDLTQPSEDSNRFVVIVIPLLLISLLLLAAGLRFYKLDTQSFWNDEGNSARLSERSLPSIIEGTASDVHPPLYYLLLRGWREMLGESEFGLRSFSGFAGILTVAATIALSRFFSPSFRRGPVTIIVLAAGLIAALNPTLVYYSQETRMYALLALISSLSTLTLLCWLNAKRHWPWAFAYVLLSTAGLYTHYFYPTVFGLQGFIILIWVVRKYVTLVFAPLNLSSQPHWARVPRNWLLMVGMSLILYLPWMPIFLRQTTGRPPERGCIPAFLWDSLRWMTFGQTINDQDLTLVTIFTALLLGWAIITRGQRVIVPILGVLLPVSAMYLAGTTNLAFFKFMIITVPFFIIWLASSLANFSRSSSPAWSFLHLIAWFLMLAVLGGMLYSLHNLYNEQAYARADYRAMAATIANADGLDSGIILNAPNQWEVFTYYYQGEAPVYPLPKGQPDPKILEPLLAEIAKNHERLYVLYWGDEQRDPEKVIENWLDRNAFKASETWVGDVRFVVYAPPRQSEEDKTSLGINFENKIVLHDVAIADDQLAPGDIIQVTLSWSAEALLEDRYKVFLHLVDVDGAIVAQQDGEPVGGMSPTSSWQPGEIITDNQGVFLPETLAPGDYELLLGLYDLNDSNKRLNVQNLETVQDHIVLGTIVVE
jgi:mannosyltransferase